MGIFGSTFQVSAGSTWVFFKRIFVARIKELERVVAVELAAYGAGQIEPVLAVGKRHGFHWLEIMPRPAELMSRPLEGRVRTARAFKPGVRILCSTLALPFSTSHSTTRLQVSLGWSGPSPLRAEADVLVASH